MVDVNTESYYYDNNQIVLRIVNNEVANRYLWGPQVDQLLADEQLGNHVYWALTDHLNTVRDLATFNGVSTSIVKHIVYNSFGGVVSDSNSFPLQFCVMKLNKRCSI